MVDSVGAMSLETNGAAGSEMEGVKEPVDSPVFHKYRSHESLRFLYGVCSKDASQREQAMETVAKRLDSWIEGYGSPVDSLTENSGAQLAVNFTAMIKERIPDLVSLSHQCPFIDVRRRSSSILTDLKVCGQNRYLLILLLLCKMPLNFIGAKIG